MESSERIPLGIAHGRFQPPHAGHLRYLLAAFGRADHVIVGISTPRLCSEEEALRTGWPCTVGLNPFSYEERVGMIEAALAAEGVPSERYSFAPFPSDYASIGDIVPKNAVFLMSVTGSGDGKKIEHLRSLGYQVETVMQVPEGREREHADAVRASVRAGTDDWKRLVSEAVAVYMQNHGLVKKLR